jgi:glycosyltransferase involved in cell wall biosynthesis
MPAYNEEACIAQVCREWLTMLESVDGSRLVVIDDGSRDRTHAILKAVAAAHPALEVVRQLNTGHGAAILNGYRRALEMGAEWIFQVDSDGQFDPWDFTRLWERSERFGFVMGYRRHRKDPLHRRAVSAALRLMIRLRFGVRLRDPNAPFRLMEARLLREFLARLPDGVFAPNILLAILARQSSGGFCEVPVHHRPRRGGTGSLGLMRLVWVLPRCLRELLGFRSRT